MQILPVCSLTDQQKLICQVRLEKTLLHATSIAHTIEVVARTEYGTVVWHKIHKCVYCRSCYALCVTKYEDVLLLSVCSIPDSTQYVCNNTEDIEILLNARINELDVSRLTLRCAGE